MIAVFQSTPNVYQPQWHPDQPTLARPGLLATVSPVPTRQPERTIAPWFAPAWVMDAQWLVSRNILRTVPGAIGLPIPPPAPPVSSQPWFEFSWRMGEQWLVTKRPPLTVPGKVGLSIPPPPAVAPAVQPSWTLDASWRGIVNLIPVSGAVIPQPPAASPLINFYAQFFPSLPLWIVPVPRLLRDASVPPNRTPDASRIADLFVGWALTAPWNAPAIQTLKDASILPLRAPEATRLADLFVAWSLISPWGMPPPRLLLDASVPPKVAPANYLLKIFSPEWAMDAPWLMQRIVEQIPPAVVAASAVPLKPLAYQLPIDPWVLIAPWNAPLRGFVKDASAVPLSAAPINFVKLFTREDALGTPWLWGVVVDQIPTTPIVASSLPPVQRANQVLADLWALTAPWSASRPSIMPASPLILAPPLRRPEVFMVQEVAQMIQWLAARPKVYSPPIIPSSFTPYSFILNYSALFPDARVDIQLLSARQQYALSIIIEQALAAGACPSTFEDMLIARLAKDMNIDGGLVRRLGLR